MLRNVKDLRGYAIRATDGVIGKVDDLYFDDDDWAIRYLVVDTGTWLRGRKVLISPIAIGPPDWMSQLLPVSLTKAQVERSPTSTPGSRCHASTKPSTPDITDTRTTGAAQVLWGMGAYPGSLTTEDRIEDELKARRTHAPQTRTIATCAAANAVIGHHIHATDGDIGHVEDLLVDDHTWAIRYLIVDTSNWWGGHHVLVAPQWIKDVSWSDANVSVGLTRQAVKNAPRYDPAAQLDRQQEQGIYEHYGRPGYWTTKAIRDGAAPPVK